MDGIRVLMVCLAQNYSGFTGFYCFPAGDAGSAANGRLSRLFRVRIKHYWRIDRVTKPGPGGYLLTNGLYIFLFAPVFFTLNFYHMKSLSKSKMFPSMIGMVLLLSSFVASAQSRWFGPISLPGSTAFNGQKKWAAPRTSMRKA